MELLEADFAVVGSGIAGLYAALNLSTDGRVLLLTCKSLTDSNSWFAQGGVAAVWSPDDTSLCHIDDTITAGTGLCDHSAVKSFVEEGPERIRQLIELGVKFDSVDGEVLLTREGGHRCRRVLHANNDATGKELESVLVQRVLENPNIRVVESFRGIDLLRDESGVSGIWGFHNNPTGFLHVASNSVTIATGGFGNLYPDTTNTEVVNGDGIVMAWHAGAAIADMEFIQFHPTALYIEGVPRYLLTEALRGEGAILLNSSRERFMQGYHPMAELAPRDIVVRAELSEMKRTSSNHVFLDARNVKLESVAKRFPGVEAMLSNHGLSLKNDLIPVAPAAHYTIGGISTGIDGRCSVPGLYAAGEAACTGIHGANRLASNSLLECLVFSHRAAEAARKDFHRPGSLNQATFGRTTWKTGRPVVQTLELKRIAGSRLNMTREASGLGKVVSEFWEPVKSKLEINYEAATPALINFRNISTIIGIVGLFALSRTESRGTHFRTDYPETDPNWVKRQQLQGTQLSFIC